MVWRRVKGAETAWSIVREVVSSRKVGQRITQGKVRAELEKRLENYKKYGSLATVNAYFNYLAGAGYIRHRYHNDPWVIVEPLPPDLSSAKLVEMYKNRKIKRGYGLQDRYHKRKFL
jgi:hypothetical protein